MTETLPEVSHDSIAAALAAAQAEFSPIVRSRTVRVQTRAGGSYTFEYAPLDVVLDAVRPVLTRHGIAISQLLDSLEGQPVLKTMLLHASGTISGWFPLEVKGLGAQEIGSLVTYMRRYALVAALGLATEEDDDGNAAAGSPSHAPARQEPSGDADGESQFKAPTAAAPRRPTAEETSGLVSVVNELFALDALTLEQLQRASGIELPWPDLAESLDADLTADLTARMITFRDNIKEATARRAREAEAGS